MIAHGLSGWSFAYNRRRTTLGLCVYHRRTIELSLPFVKRNGEEVIRDTLLHEIVHALVGPGHGHDAVWRSQCLAIGARSVRCGHADMPPGRWQARCKGCGRAFHRHRQPQPLAGWFCRHCGPGRGGLVWQLG
jgi:predicted SprT family Zn-dependent metalloprotease